MDITERLRADRGAGAIHWADCREAADEIEALRSQNAKLDSALREKDRAMGVLFDRAFKSGLDWSDLIS